MTALELCGRCKESVAAARDALARDTLLDLAGLDAEIARMCGEFAGMPAAERIGAAEALRELVAALDLLTIALGAQQARWRDSALRRARERAADTYRRAPTADREPG
jgi:hypothetical protein